MTLSLGSIFKPLNDFFLERFDTTDGSQVVFRFDRFGSVVSDDDFIDESHPESGPLGVLARERFSDLVNRVPMDEGDGVNVVLSANSIDSMYHDQLLSGSMPFIPDGSDEATKQAITERFNAMKSEALRVWEQLELQSLDGTMLDYKPSRAIPEDWYDSRSNESWTDHTFMVSEPAELRSDTDAATPATHLWRMKVSDAALRSVLAAGAEEAGAPEGGGTSAQPDPTTRARVRDHRAAAQPDPTTRARVRDHRAAAQPDPTTRARVRDHRAAAHMRATPRARGVSGAITRMVSAAPGGAAFVAKDSIRARMTPALRAVSLDPTILKAAGLRGGSPSVAAASGGLSDGLRRARFLNIRRRVDVSRVIADVAPTEPVTTDKMTIKFQYCLVRIDRPWLKSGFITPSSWYVPGVARGALTAPEGGLMPLLPIGFIAIRNLKISANWSADDIARASEATDLGPFRVGGHIANNEVTHPGLQIIGWLLQRLPELPPF
jgi:hypothetical protein